MNRIEILFLNNHSINKHGEYLILVLDCPTFKERIDATVIKNYIIKIAGLQTWLYNNSRP